MSPTAILLFKWLQQEKKHGVKGERERKCVRVFVFSLELRSRLKEEFQSSDLLDVSTCLGLLGGQMWDGWTASEGGSTTDRGLFMWHGYRIKQWPSLTDLRSTPVRKEPVWHVCLRERMREREECKWKLIYFKSHVTLYRLPRKTSHVTGLWRVISQNWAVLAAKRCGRQAGAGSVLHLHTGTWGVRYQ